MLAWLYCSSRSAISAASWLICAWTCPCVAAVAPCGERVATSASADAARQASARNRACAMRPECYRSFPGPSQFLSCAVGITLSAMARIELLEGDITRQDVDAIVTPATRSRPGGGGGDGPIPRRGAPAIVEECRRIRAERYPDGLP